MCFEKVVHMEVGWFDEPENSSGAMGARLSADASLIRTLVGDSLALTVKNLASALSGMIIAFVASWELSIIILILIPLTGINNYVQVKFMKGFSADAKVSWFFFFCLNEFFRVFYLWKKKLKVIVCRQSTRRRVRLRTMRLGV